MARMMIWNIMFDSLLWVSDTKCAISGLTVTISMGRRNSLSQGCRRVITPMSTDSSISR